MEDVASAAERFASMGKLSRRAAFDQLVRHAFTLTGGEFARALDFNARLVSELRERKIALFD